MHSFWCWPLLRQVAEPPPPGEGHGLAINNCVRADALVFYHIGAEDKPIFPVFIGLVGRPYPANVLGAYYPPESVAQRLADSTFYVTLVANIRRFMPAETHAPERLLEFGTIAICLGREQLFLGSQRDAIPFFQALLPTIVPTTPAEMAAKADLEKMGSRIGW